MDFMVDGSALRDALRMTAHATAKDEARPVLLWHWFVPGTDGCDVYAADNYRVARYRLPVAPEGEPFAIDAEDAALLVRWLAKRKTVDVRVEDQFVTVVDVDTDRASTRMRRPTGTPPDYAAIIPPADGAPTVTLNPRFMGEAGKAMGKEITVEARITDPFKPVLLTAGDRYTEVVMPVRVPDLA